MLALVWHRRVALSHERMADGAEGGSRRSAEAIEAQILRGGGDISTASDPSKLEPVLEELASAIGPGPSGALAQSLWRVAEAHSSRKRGRHCARLALLSLQRIGPAIPASVLDQISKHASDPASPLCLHSIRTLRSANDPSCLFHALRTASSAFASSRSASTPFPPRDLRRAPECGLISPFLRGALACYAASETGALPDDDLLSAALASADGCAASNALAVVERRAKESAPAADRLLQQRVAFARGRLVSREPFATRLDAASNPSKGLNLESRLARCSLARIAGCVIHSREVILSRGAEAGRQTFLDTLKELTQDRHHSVAFAALRALFADGLSSKQQSDAWKSALANNTPMQPIVTSANSAAAFAVELTRHFVRSSSEPSSAEACKCAKIIGRAACAAGSDRELQDELLELARSVLQVLQHPNSSSSLNIRALEALVYLPGATDGRFLSKLVEHLHCNKRTFLKDDVRRVLDALADRIRVRPETGCTSMLEAALCAASRYPSCCDAAGLTSVMEAAIVYGKANGSDHDVLKKLKSLLYGLMTPQHRQEDGLCVSENDKQALQASVGYVLGEHANEMCNELAVNHIDGDEDDHGAAEDRGSSVVLEDRLRAPPSYSQSSAVSPMRGEGADRFSKGANHATTTMDLQRAALTVNPPLSSVINALACACASSGWEVQTVCSEALEKIAIRSAEPLRHVCYQQLRLMVKREAGVAAQAFPALRFLDTIYRSIDQLRHMQRGEAERTDIALWVASRHRVLLQGLESRCKLNHERFLPLGPCSRDAAREAAARIGSHALTEPLPGDVDRLAVLLSGREIDDDGIVDVHIGEIDTAPASSAVDSGHEWDASKGDPFTFAGDSKISDLEANPDRGGSAEPRFVFDDSDGSGFCDDAPSEAHQSSGGGLFASVDDPAGDVFSEYDRGPANSIEGEGDEDSLYGTFGEDELTNVQSGTVLQTYYDAENGIEFEAQTPVDVTGEDEKGEFHHCTDMMMNRGRIPKGLVELSLEP